MIIADTCLVVHLFNETDLTSPAQQVLKKDPSWILPVLWQEEYANVISKLAKKTKRNATEVIKHYDFALDEFKGSEISVDNRSALRFALDYNISVYDAHFVCLAIEFSVWLITEDQEILKKCPHRAMSIQDFIKM